MWVKRGFLFRQRQHEFVLMANTGLARFVFAIVPPDFEKAGNLSRTIPRPASWRPSHLPSQQAHAELFATVRESASDPKRNVSERVNFKLRRQNGTQPDRVYGAMFISWKSLPSVGS